MSLTKARKNEREANQLQAEIEALQKRRGNLISEALELRQAYVIKNAKKLLSAFTWHVGDEGDQLVAASGNEHNRPLYEKLLKVWFSGQYAPQRAALDLNLDIRLFKSNGVLFLNGRGLLDFAQTHGLRVDNEDLRETIRRVEQVASQASFQVDTVRRFGQLTS